MKIRFLFVVSMPSQPFSQELKQAMAPISTFVVAAVRLTRGTAFFQHLWFFIFVHSNYLDHMEGDVGNAVQDGEFLYRNFIAFLPESVRIVFEGKEHVIMPFVVAWIFQHVFFALVVAAVVGAQFNLTAVRCNQRSGVDYEHVLVGVLLCKVSQPFA